MILCLSGLTLSYFFLALALTLKSLWLFIAGRLVGGFFSGSLPVAQASIIDLTTENKRARFIDYIMFFVSLGYVVGPLIGGYLSDPTIMPWFSKVTLPNPINSLLEAVRAKDIRVYSLLLLLIFFYIG